MRQAIADGRRPSLSRRGRGYSGLLYFRYQLPHSWLGLLERKEGQRPLQSCNSMCSSCRTAATVADDDHLLARTHVNSWAAVPIPPSHSSLSTPPHFRTSGERKSRACLYITDVRAFEIQVLREVNPTALSTAGRGMNLRHESGLPAPPNRR